MTTSTIFTVKAGACPTYDPDEPNYSPFQNLEEKRIRSACLASEETQRAYFAIADVAHAICLWYWASRFWDYPVLDIAGRPISRTEAVEYLRRFCRRPSELAVLNLDNSKYIVAKNRLPSQFGEPIATALTSLAKIFENEALMEG